MDLWQSGIKPLKSEITKIVICIYLLGVITSNDAAVPVRPFPSYLDVLAVLEDFTNYWQADFFADKNVCWSQGCINAAREVRSNMDIRADPCTNFYQFACGGFINKSIIPDGAQIVDKYEILQNDIEKKLISMIEDENEPDEPKSFRLVKNMYRSCTNMTEDREIEHVKEILKKLGGWPALEGDSWDDTRFNWKRWMYEARKVGDFGNCFFDFEFSLNTAGTKIVINLNRPEMENQIWSVFYSGWHNVEEHYNLFVKIARIFGVDKDRATTEIKESFELAVEIVKIILPPSRVPKESVLFNGTFLELKKTHPNVKWSEYFNNFLPPNTSLTDDQIVVVENPFYYSQLEALMSNTTKRVQANYAFWRVIWKKMVYINGRIRDSYYKLEFGEDIKPIPLWLACLNDIKASLYYSLNARYVRKYVSKETKERATEMFEHLKQQLNITLQQAEWLDEEARKVLLEKAAAIKSHIAYHDVLLDDTVDENLHRGMQFTKDNFLGNKFNLISAVLAAKSDVFLRDPREFIPRKVIDITASVNAYYNTRTNDVDIPASILQDGFYSVDRPTYMNYGAMGTIIGHELTHAYDSRNINYDKDGKYTDPLTESSKNALDERAQCFVDEYANFTGKKLKVSSNVIREIIADNGGIKLARRAYKDWVLKNGEERRLPGFENYLPIHMFWISVASIDCSKETEQYLKSQISDSTHPIHKFRTNSMTSNTPEFAEDFECLNKSDLAVESTTFAMIPEKRCSVW